MNQIIMYIMAAGVLLGAVDRIFGNKKGYGVKLEEGFMMLGPTALSMVGMICLAPVLSAALGKIIIPLYQMIGVDPAMFGSVLAIDMGGYQLAKELALNPLIGSYSGIIVAAVFGCTIVFTIPVGMGMIEQEDKPVFARGIMIGLAAMPVALLVGGLACGLSVGTVLYQNVPVFLAALLLVGLIKMPERMIKGFTVFSAGIRIVITIGLALGAFTYLSGIELVKGLAPIEEAMGVVSSIGIVLLGSLPIIELLQRLLKKPFTWFGRKCRMNDAAIAGLLVTIVSVVPTFTMIKNMDRRGKIVNVAFMVSATATLAAHLGFTVSTEPDMLGALLLSKLVGGITAAAALFMVRSEG